MSCEYERLREKNILDNKRVLAELGLLNPFKPLPQVVHRAPKRKRLSQPVREKKYVISTGEEDIEGYGSRRGVRRRSSRIQGKVAPDGAELAASEISEEGSLPRKSEPRPNVYGSIPVNDTLLYIENTYNDEDFEVDTPFSMSRPPVSGIHGGPEGAYSIALSGGYQDDIDLGECLTFTGEGGRDLKGTKANPKNLRTAAQTKDQVLTRGNLALSYSVTSGLPVRVIRGYKLRSDYAPAEGYRYDGLYKVEKYWFTTGMSGFGVYKFALKRLSTEPAPPWRYTGEQSELSDNVKLPVELGDGDSAETPSTESQDSGIGSEDTESSDDKEVNNNDKVNKNNYIDDDTLLTDDNNNNKD